jgi:hypothetical protein
MSNYYTLADGLNKAVFTERSNVTNYPYGYYEVPLNALSDSPIINMNVAGYRPYEKKTIENFNKIVATPELKINYPSSLLLPEEYPVTYPCTTIFPQNAHFKKTREIHIAP